MSEWLVNGSIVLAALSGVPGLFLQRTSVAAERFANVVLIFSALLGLTAAIVALVPTATIATFGLFWPWPAPGGALALRVDAIAAIFLLPMCLIAALGSIYARGYWPQSQHPRDGRKLRFFYGLLTAALILIVCARNTMLFLAAWEIMALSAFMALTAQDDKKVVREAGYVFLVAARLSMLCLLAMFVLLFMASGEFAFTRLTGLHSQALANAIFVLAVVGFGLKAGIMPLHVWLPQAHARAPSHLSALFSGVLIKVGIYGIVRVTSVFMQPPAWWGVLLLVLGAISGVLGVAFAIGQHDLKRLLAYHSIENIGIICMGIGLALLGRALNNPALIVLGIAGALLHVWNHGLFKALLFLAAGSVLHATGTRDMDKQGGLARRMPFTALAFVIGAIAICGLPPLNGLVSELFIYLGLFRTISLPTSTLWLAGAAVAPILALIGALALACFVKAYGVVFLGEARCANAERAHEACATMLWPMGVLAAGCIFIGLFPPLIAPVFTKAAKVFAPELAGVMPTLASISPLSWLVILAAALWVSFFGVLLLLRARTISTSISASAPVTVGTWDCGFAAPTPRMQYSSSSLAKNLVGFFAWVLGPKVHMPRVQGLFARSSAFHSDVPDAVLTRLVNPLLRATIHMVRYLRWMQSGSSQAYVLGILLTLIVLLLWH